MDRNRAEGRRPGARAPVRTEIPPHARRALLEQLSCRAPVRRVTIPYTRTATGAPPTTYLGPDVCGGRSPGPRPSVWPRRAKRVTSAPGALGCVSQSPAGPPQRTTRWAGRLSGETHHLCGEFPDTHCQGSPHRQAAPGLIPSSHNGCAGWGSLRQTRPKVGTAFVHR